MDRLTNKQNDIHTRQAFHNKEPIEYCSRIEYHEEDLRKYNFTRPYIQKSFLNVYLNYFQLIFTVKFVPQLFRTAVHQSQIGMTIQDQKGI